MPVEDTGPLSERAQTDESLRFEREKADHALQEGLAAIDEIADAVISRARARADAVLAAARAKTDRQPAVTAASAQSSSILETERRLADEVLREERADADETLLDERAGHAARMSAEREETDKHLFTERARSDDALATRDEFLGVVSHELRNMLNAVVGFASVIAEEVSQEHHVEAVRRHAQRIQRSGARMGRLVGDLVDVASIEAGRLEVRCESGDPTEVVTEAVETFQAHASASGVALAFEIVPPLPLAAFDPARLLQVFANLLSNAIKFTPAGGDVVVHVERVGDHIQFAVSDTGPGIPPDRLEAVFVRFLQLNQNDRRGVGLGLYIAKSIVHGHGGRIWAASRIGEGSTFYFTLPIPVAP